MFARRNERELSWKLLLGLVASLRSARSATTLLRGQQKASESVSVSHGGEAMGTAVSGSLLFFFFFSVPLLLREPPCQPPRPSRGWQSRWRFTRRHSPIFKRTHKGACLMIYYPAPLWKSKWILESAPLFKSRPGGM